MEAGGGLKEGTKCPKTTDVKSPEGGDDTVEDDFIREKNLLLLSALYYMYGEDWKDAPDWWGILAIANY